MSGKDTKLTDKCFVLLEPCTPKAQLALSAELRNVIHERNILTSKTRKKFLSALDELNNADVETRRQSRKKKCVQEILDSEVVYLKQLELIMEYFMKPLRNKQVLTQHQYDTLFGSINSIYKVNGELLHELRQNLTNVASAFSKLAPFFKMYSVYAYDYKKCLDMLERLYGTNPEFLKVLYNQESRPEVQAKLSSLLIAPIQRIPRYCLLLKQVLESTLVTDPDYNVLKDSLDKLEEVARHVNSLVEDRENSQRLLELLRCIKNDKTLIIKPGRKLIKEGTLCYVRDKNKPHDKIYIILMSDIIIGCKIKKHNITLPNSLKCIYIYPLNKCKVTQNQSTKMFEIECNDQSMILYHKNGTESDEWIRIINLTIYKSIRNRLTLRKGSSSRRPNNFAQYSDLGISPGVTRIKKRRRTDDEDYTEDTEVKPKQSKVSENRLSFLPTRIGRRKSLQRTIRPNLDLNQSGKDSLFPLRQQLGNENKNETQMVQSDLFVFGHENSNRGFTFKLEGVFNGIMNTFKRMFGFKQQQT